MINSVPNLFTALALCVPPPPRRRARGLGGKAGGVSRRVGRGGLAPQGRPSPRFPSRSPPRRSSRCARVTRTVKAPPPSCASTPVRKHRRGSFDCRNLQNGCLRSEQQMRKRQKSVQMISPRQYPTFNEDRKQNEKTPGAEIETSTTLSDLRSLSEFCTKICLRGEWGGQPPQYPSYKELIIKIG